MADELERHPRVLRINELTAGFKQSAEEFSRGLQQHERSGHNEPTAEHRQQLKALNDLHLRIRAEIKALQDEFGIPEELIRSLEKQEMPLLEDRYWKRWGRRSEISPARRSESGPLGGRFILRGSRLTTVKLPP